MTDPVCIKIQEGGAGLENALAFIAKTYQKAFNTIPPPAHILLVAQQGSSLVGTIGIETCDHDRSLRLESIYSVDYANTPLPYKREELVEFGRWISTIPFVSEPLLFAACSHAYRLGKRTGWCEHTNKVHRAATRLGIEFSEICGAKLNINKIPDTDKNFYHGECMPRLYMVSIAQALDAMSGKVKKLLTSGKLVFDDRIIVP